MEDRPEREEVRLENQERQRRPAWGVERPYFLSLLLMLGAFVFSPWVESVEAAGLHVGGFLYLLLLCGSLWLGVTASEPGRGVQRWANVLTIAAIASGALLLGFPEDSLVSVSIRNELTLLMVLACFVMLRVLLRAERVNADKIFCAILVYLLLGVMWAFMYGTVDRVTEAPAIEGATLGSTPGSDGEPQELSFTSDLLYFSFVTLTTLGYGDILPAQPGTRILAVLEAIVGQVYLTILVARLVAMHLMREEATPPET